MKQQTFAGLITDEFNQLLEGCIAREDDRIEPSVFLHALADLEQRRTVKEIELNGGFVNGQVIFSTPAPD